VPLKVAGYLLIYRTHTERLFHRSFVSVASHAAAIFEKMIVHESAFGIVWSRYFPAGNGFPSISTGVLN
jgi:hypothetical protein